VTTAPREPDEPSGPLIELAGAVADRTPVDWASEQARTPEQGARLARLRELAAFEAAVARVRDASPAQVLFAWGPLQALEAIGEGSFARIFRAWDPALQREVALKLRRADVAAPLLGARRWIDEARRLARVRHPNVVAILGADEHDGQTGLWTELISGSTLEQWIAAQGPLGPREAAGVGIDLCHALAAVHATGLLHGDVTTRNVMREGGAGAADRSGRIVLMDFGSAHDARAVDLVAFGTPLFMAPEVLAGEAPDVRADVYSLGVVLYRLLTARYPIEPGSLDAMRGRLQRGERVPLRTARPDLPAALVEAVERACEPARERRWASVAELERALSRAFEPTRDAAVPRRRMAGLAIAAGVAVAIVAGLLLVRPVGQGTRGVGEPRNASPPAAAGSAIVAPVVPPLAPLELPPQLSATLLRVTAGGREALRTGDLVAPGDELALEVDARERVHVYVLSEDETGAVFVLFPLASRGARNPVAAGSPQRLPGTESGRALTWQVTSAGGRETFLVLASRTPLAPVADVAAAIPEAQLDAPVSYRALPAEALARLRGVGGVVRAPTLPEPTRSGILAALARDLGRPAEGRAIWMRLVVLENPAP